MIVHNEFHPIPQLKIDNVGENTAALPTGEYQLGDTHYNSAIRNCTHIIFT